MGKTKWMWLLMLTTVLAMGLILGTACGDDDDDDDDDSSDDDTEEATAASVCEDAIAICDDEGEDSDFESAAECETPFTDCTDEAGYIECVAGCIDDASCAVANACFETCFSSNCDEVFG
ncbi:hypothetical protein KDL45_01960 [bacterium]|nr:hypothetical protein [bacterium]